jgi:hypothetical protein
MLLTSYIGTEHAQGFHFIDFRQEGHLLPENLQDPFKGLAFCTRFYWRCHGNLFRDINILVIVIV